MEEENSKTERRRQPRIVANLPLKIGSNGASVITQTKNISTLGVHCQVEEDIPIMTKVSVTLIAPVPAKGKVVTKKIDCEGVVVRSESLTTDEGVTRYSVAIFFSDIGEAERKLLSRYVQTNTGRT